MLFSSTVLMRRDTSRIWCNSLLWWLGHWECLPFLYQMSRNERWKIWVFLWKRSYCYANKPIDIPNLDVVCSVCHDCSQHNTYVGTTMTWFTWSGFRHDDVIKCDHFARYWPFVGGIHRSPVNSPHKGQWLGALMFSFTCALNKRLSKQWWGWWFETSSRSSWRHCNDKSVLDNSYKPSNKISFI